MFFIGPPFGNYITFVPFLSPIKGSYTLEPRTGLIVQIFKTLRYNSEYGGWVNKIGLRNKGIDYAISNYQKGQIVSVAILKEEEIPVLQSKIPPDMDLEINVSCPNTERDMVHHGLKGFLSPQREWCILKLKPTTTLQTVDQYYEQGFRQFHCSNTIPVSEGGLSGKALIPYNDKLIPYIKTTYPDTTVIAGGGVTTMDDILHYKAIGADHVSFSTVAFCPIAFVKLLYTINQKTK